MKIDSKHMESMISILKNSLKHKDIDLIKFDIEQAIKTQEQNIRYEAWRQSDIGKKEIEERRKKVEQDCEKLKNGTYASAYTSDEWYARLKELGVDLFQGYSCRAEYEKSEEYKAEMETFKKRREIEENRQKLALAMAPDQPWQDFEGRTQHRVDKILEKVK
jgi:hypothetical protein